MLPQDSNFNFFDCFVGNCIWACQLIGHDVFVLESDDDVYWCTPKLLDGLNCESKWRTPNSLKNSNVSPSRKQWKKEESGHTP